MNTWFSNMQFDWVLTTIRVALILVSAWTVILLLQRSIRAMRMRIASRMDDHEAIKRAETLSRVARYIVAVTASLVATMLVLAELGISLAPIMGAAGVAGLAVGFGAQSLVKDYFSGFFILLENQLRQSDVVKLGNHVGLVEEVTLRYIRLRDYDGNVYFIPNGEVRTVVNYSRDFAQAVIDVGIAYRENIDEVTALMQEVARELCSDSEYGTKILDKFELVGLDRWANSAIHIIGRFRVLPLEQWSVRREYLRRLKYAFDAQGIRIVE